MVEWVRALDWQPGGPLLGSNPAAATLAIPFTQLCQCLSEETLKAVGPFYLVSMPGEVKDPTSLHWKYGTCRRTTLKISLILKFECSYYIHTYFICVIANQDSFSGNCAHTARPSVPSEHLSSLMPA